MQMEDGTINSDIYQYVGLIIQFITIWYDTAFNDDKKLVLSVSVEISIQQQFVALLSERVILIPRMSLLSLEWNDQPLNFVIVGMKCGSWSDDIPRYQFSNESSY